MKKTNSLSQLKNKNDQTKRFITKGVSVKTQNHLLVTEAAFEGFNIIMCTCHLIHGNRGGIRIYSLTFKPHRGMLDIG